MQFAILFFAAAFLWATIALAQNACCFCFASLAFRFRICCSSGVVSIAGMVSTRGMTVAGVSMVFFPSTCRWRTVRRVSVGFCKRQVLLLRTRCPFAFHFSKVDATRGRYGRERVCGVCGIFPSFWACTNRERGRGGIHAHMCRWSQPKTLTARRSSSTSTVLRGELRGNHGCWSAGACVGFQRRGERRTLLARVRTWSSGSKLSRRRQ